MKFKHLVQIACILIGAVLLAYNVQSLPIQNDYDTVNSLSVHETNRGNVALNWNAVDRIEIDYNNDTNTPIYAEPRNYFIYKSTGSIAENDEINLLDATSETDYTDGDVKQNTTYFYRIRVQYSDGKYSPMGNEEDVKTSRLTSAQLDQNEIDIYPGGTQSVNLHLVAQNDGDTHQITIRLSENEEELSASVDSDEFTLNSGEETDIAINVSTTSRIEEDDYRIDVRVTSDGITKTLPLKVNVGDDGRISFKLESGSSFCNDTYTRELSVEIENNTSDDFENIFLDIVDSPLGATIEPQDINLRHGQQKSVKIKVNLDPSSTLSDDYIIIVSASPEDQPFVSYGRIAFEVNNCATSNNQSFSLTWNKPSGPWTKGKQYDVNFNIIPAGSGTQRVDINVWTSSPMPIQYALTEYTLENKTTRTRVTFFPQSDTIPGDLNIIIRATNGSVTRELKADRGVRILPLDQFTFTPVKKNIIVTEGFPSEVEFTIQNGDVDHTFSFSVNADSDLNVLPLGSIFIPKRETRTFKTLVTAKPNSEDALSFSVTGGTSGVNSQTTRVQVSVLKDNTPNYSSLKVLSFNETIRVDQNEEQEVTFSLQNDSTFDMSNIIITVAGLPQGATFQSINLAGLSAGQIRNVSSKIVTGKETPNGTYELQWTINAGRFTTRVKSELVVGPREENGDLIAGISTGFATLGKNWLVGLIVLLAVIGGLVVLSKIGQGVVGNNDRKENWLK